MDFNQFVTEFINNILALQGGWLIIGVPSALMLVFWLLVTGWVWNDITERTDNQFFKLISVFMTFILGVPGLLIYLLIRPKDTLSEVYWSELEKRYLFFETKELRDCPKCDCELFPGFAACPNCGYEIMTACKSCGKYSDKVWKFCAYCGDAKEAIEDEFMSAEMAMKARGADIEYTSLGEDLSGFISNLTKGMREKMAKSREARRQKKARRQRKKVEARKAKEEAKRKVKEEAKKKAEDEKRARKAREKVEKAEKAQKKTEKKEDTENSSKSKKQRKDAKEEDSDGKDNKSQKEGKVSGNKAPDSGSSYEEKSINDKPEVEMKNRQASKRGEKAKRRKNSN